MGYASGTIVGMAAATFGLISGVLVGGSTAKRLIEKYDLKPDENETIHSDIESINAAMNESRTHIIIIKNVAVILICMSLGIIISGWVSKLIGMSFPTYVSSMFVAVIIRNINESIRLYEFDFDLVTGIGDVTLGLFLSMALMSLKLRELSALFGPLLILLSLQVVFLVLACYFVIFRLLGGNYDAAVMCAGLLGHGLGATPSAIVNMSAVNERYGMSRKTMMIVPIDGAFLVDIIYQPTTIWFIKIFVQPR